MGIGELRGGKMGANGKMQYNPGWESGSMKTLAAHGLAGGIVQALVVIAEIKPNITPKKFPVGLVRYRARQNGR
jgi:hypothetical protein